jgi:cytochrome c
VVLWRVLPFLVVEGEKSAETSAEATATAEAAPVEVSLEDKYKDDPIYIKGIGKSEGLGLYGMPPSGP